MLDRLFPFIFVLIWSTGWICGRYLVGYADPLTFLVVRFVLAALFLAIYALATRAPWPKTLAQAGHAAVVGMLLHAIYTGGIWWGIGHGVPASVSALLVAVQPVLTAVLAPALLGERIDAARWLGVALGFVGVLCVLEPSLADVPRDHIARSALPLAVTLLAVVSVTAGSLYQKAFVVGGDLRTITLLQYVGATALILPVSLLVEPGHIVWNVTTVGVLLWSVLALSIGGVAMLLAMIRHGDVSRAAQYIYLVPAVAALQAYVLFGERLNVLQLLGMVVTAAGVLVANRKRRETVGIAAGTPK